MFSFNLNPTFSWFPVSGPFCERASHPLPAPGVLPKHAAVPSGPRLQRQRPDFAWVALGGLWVPFVLCQCLRFDLVFLCWPLLVRETVLLPGCLLWLASSRWLFAFLCLPWAGRWSVPLCVYTSACLFVCLFVCLLACLLACFFFCFPRIAQIYRAPRF